MKNEKEMRTDIAALAVMTDEDIDCSDIPALSEEWLNSAEWFAEHPKKIDDNEEKETISLRVDRSTLDFYRSFGRGYQKRINDVLRNYAERERGVQSTKTT